MCQGEHTKLETLNLDRVLCFPVVSTAVNMLSIAAQSFEAVFNIVS